MSDGIVPETDSSGAAYTLLETCNQKLPQNKIVRQITFGRFITLSSATVEGVGHDAGIAKSVVLPMSVINGLMPSDTANLSAPTPIKELQADPVPRRDIPTVAVEHVAELIASREVRLGPGRVGIMLNSSAVAQLLYGGRVVVPLSGTQEPGAVWLDASKAKDAIPVPVAGVHDIHDVNAFLAYPQVTASNGQQVAVTLTAENVVDLLNNRSTETDGPSNRLTLVPRTASTDETRSRSYVRRADMTTPASGTENFFAVEPPPADRTMLPDRTGDGDLLSPALGFYIPYVQTWTTLGYSRGALLNTIALAPLEETTIELFTWDRHTSALEQTSSSEVEQNLESVDVTKDTKQVAGELTRDSNFKAEAHAHAQVKVQVVEAGADAGGEVGGAAKDIARQTTDFIHESTRKATMRVRASRQSKVSETHEFGREQRTTRKLKNVNMCHSLSLDYFEMLVSYAMQTTCLRKEAQLVVLLDLPAPYDWRRRETIRRYEPVLKSALIDRSFVAGFDASRLLAARDQAFAAVCEKCVCASEGDALASESTELEDVRAAAFLVWQTVKRLLNSASPANVLVALAIVAPRTPSQALPDTLPGVAERLHQWLFMEHAAYKAPAVWSGLRGLATTSLPATAAGISVQKLKTLHAIVNPPGAKTSFSEVMTVDDAGKKALHDAVYPIAFAEYRGIAKNELEALGEATALLIPDPIVAAFVGWLNGVIAGLAASAIDDVAANMGIAALNGKYRLALIDDLGLVSAIAAFDEAYTGWQSANADLLKHTGAVANALDTLANERNDQLRSAFPLSSVAEAREREDALMMHLADNNNYYSFALYQAQLSSDSAKLPALVTASSGLISPNAMGMVASKLAFPVNLDDLPAAASPATVTALRAWFDRMIRNNVELDRGPPSTVVSLPTPGIALETRLGGCDGCEDFIDETRKIDLRQRAALASQAESEANRYAARRQLVPPDLSDPSAHRRDPAFTVKVVQEVPAPPI